MAAPCLLTAPLGQHARIRAVGHRIDPAGDPFKLEDGDSEGCPYAIGLFHDFTSLRPQAGNTIMLVTLETIQGLHIMFVFESLLTIFFSYNQAGAIAPQRC